MSEVTSNPVLEQALKHVSKCRENDSHNNDIWQAKQLRCGFDGTFQSVA